MDALKQSCPKMNAKKKGESDAAAAIATHLHMCVCVSHTNVFKCCVRQNAFVICHRAITKSTHHKSLYSTEFKLLTMDDTRLRGNFNSTNFTLNSGSRLVLLSRCAVLTAQSEFCGCASNGGKLATRCVPDGTISQS